MMERKKRQKEWKKMMNTLEKEYGQKDKRKQYSVY